MATTFLSAPPISQPMTSSFVYTRSRGVAQSSCTAFARDSSAHAATIAVEDLPDYVQAQDRNAASFAIRPGMTARRQKLQRHHHVATIERCHAQPRREQWIVESIFRPGTFLH